MATSKIADIKIADVKIVPIQGAYYYEDITALQMRSIPEDERWDAPGVTPGFSKVREIAEGVSIGLVLNDASVHWGDCIAVSYSGKAGRKGVFRSKQGIQDIKSMVVPAVKGLQISSFRELEPILNNEHWHNAIRYGLSQALLRAVAWTHRENPFRTLCREWQLSIDTKLVPIQGSSGNDRYSNADKMIVNRLAALPHTQVDDIEHQLGPSGEVLLEYGRWIKNRILKLADDSYNPTIHLDVHGSIGKIFKLDPDKVCSYLSTLAEVCAPYTLRMESVVIMESRDQQIEYFKALRKALKQRAIPVLLCADEWANTKEDILAFASSGAADMIHIKMPDLGSVHESLEAVLGCKKLGIDTLLGGSCIETELSTQIAVHVAMASHPSAILAKPGMGINEAIMLVRNEMNRIGAIG